MSATPDLLYKYLPPNRIGVIRDLLIRFTQASSMNDTLEFRWPTSSVDEPEKLSRRIKEHLFPHASAAFPKEKKDRLDAACGLPGFSDQWIEIQLDDIAHRGSADRNQRHKEIAEKTFQKLNTNYGILSLSELSCDHQMWSHYADGGRGFLIEFDAQNSWFHATRNPDDGFNELTKVEYLSVRPVKNLLDIKDEVLYTKSDSWSHEQEWRIVRSFNDAKVKIERPDSYGNELLLFEIPPDAIKGVIIGFSARPELEMEIRTVLANNRSLNHVALKHATQSLETGQISITSMNEAVTVD
jgi:hypothetical protein